MRLLYLCNNDGSDPRINKEIRTLSKAFKIDFVGMRGGEMGNCFIEPFIAEQYIISADRRSIPGLFRYFITAFNLLRKNEYHSVHIINEPLLVLCYPLLLVFRPVLVLDLFDSIFLRLNRSGEQWLFLKRILYSIPDRIIVTDQTRKGLLPSFAREKSIVLPNYPPVITKEDAIKLPSEGLTIMYYGWFGKFRGTDLAMRLLEASECVRLIMAGWPGDQESQTLLKHKRVEYHGIITQEMAIRLAAEKADYILCVYSPVNENNIYASPNKVYDAIQANVPLIMNSDVKISEWVHRNRLGYILESLQVTPDKLVADLIKHKDSFVYSEKLKEAFVWEKIENRLLNAHQYENTVMHQSI